MDLVCTGGFKKIGPWIYLTRTGITGGRDLNSCHCAVIIPFQAVVLMISLILFFAA
jgi:hypothetical protein